MQIIQRFQRGSGPQTQDGKRERKVTKKNEYAEKNHTENTREDTHWVCG